MSSEAPVVQSRRAQLERWIAVVAVALLVTSVANEWFARTSYNATLRALEAGAGQAAICNLIAMPQLVRGYAWQEIEPHRHTQIVQLHWWSPFTQYRVYVLTRRDGQVLAVSTTGSEPLRSRQEQEESAAEIQRHLPPGNRAPPPRGRRRSRQMYLAYATAPAFAWRGVA
jgi:hypothetical protein